MLVKQALATKETDFLLVLQEREGVCIVLVAICNFNKRDLSQFLTFPVTKETLFALIVLKLKFCKTKSEFVFLNCILFSVKIEGRVPTDIFRMLSACTGYRCCRWKFSILDSSQFRYFLKIRSKMTNFGKKPISLQN